MRIVTFAERPELDELGWAATQDCLPDYNTHGDTLSLYWSRLALERPEFQFCLLGDRDEVLGRGQSLPVRWDGSVADLPAGIDGAIERGFGDERADTLCAMVIAIPRGLQGRGISADALRAMREIAHRHGLGALIAPVRPSWKERYPLAPIDRYSAWRLPDGRLFDPWMRVHQGLGAAILSPDPRSLRISGSVADWESWTGMPFPDSGDHWFPGGLATVAIDLERDSARYWEPNVWMHHPL